MHKNNFTPTLQEKVIALLSAGDGDTCWEWMGSKTVGGYGRIGHNYRLFYVHRVMYESQYGPIPDGVFVCHRCDNPSCCNPAHLFLGTPKENMDDRDRKGRQARGDSSGMAKLTEAQVAEIRHLRACGWTLAAIGEAFGVKPPTVGAIVTRATWKHIP